MSSTTPAPRITRARVTPGTDAVITTGEGAAVVPRERLRALDVFRGLTVAGMLLVNNPGSWAHIYPPLAHAPWHGWTPTDLIFPFFLFIVGITTALSRQARRARTGDDEGEVGLLLRRGALIFLFGLFLSWFPGFTWATVADNPDPSFLDRVGDRLLRLRIPGVLQRIALAYVAAALLTRRGSLRRHVATIAALLLGYWLVMTALPVPDHGYLGQLVLGKPSLTMAAWVDRLLLDWGRWGNHLWASSRSWDPEGVLSTVPAIGTAMLGVLAGRWIGERRPLEQRIVGLYAAGSLGTVAGLVWGWVFPINKGIWTSSYVLFGAGVACLALATIMWLIDVHRVERWSRPFVAFGVNPMLAFVGSGLMARLIYSIIKVPVGGQPVSLQKAVYDAAYASWLPPRLASLAFALSFVGVWYLVLRTLHRRGIIFKV